MIERIVRSETEKKLEDNQSRASQSRSKEKSNFNKSLNGKNINISYDANAVAPRKGELSLMLENSNLHFFQGNLFIYCSEK